MTKYPIFTPVSFLFLIARARCAEKGGGQGHVGGEIVCVSVQAKLFWSVIYCTKPRTDTKSKSVSRYHMVLARKAPQIMQDYNLATAIAIGPLT